MARTVEDVKKDLEALDEIRATVEAVEEVLLEEPSAAKLVHVSLDLRIDGLRLLLSKIAGQTADLEYRLTGNTDAPAEKGPQ